MAKTGRPPYMWTRAEEVLGYKTGMWVLGCMAAGMTADEMRTELAGLGLEVHVNTVRQWRKKVMG